MLNPLVVSNKSSHNEDGIRSSESSTTLRWFRPLLLTLIFFASSEAIARFGIATYLWGSIYVMFVFFTIRDFDSIIAMLKPNWFILALPLITLLSVFWSSAPEWSLRASLQLIFTSLIGIWIGSTFPPRTIFQTLCLGTGIGILASVVNEFIPFTKGYHEGEYIGAERFFLGIFNQKNAIGKIIDILSLSLIVVGIASRKSIVTITIVLLLWNTLIKAKSASTMLIYLFFLTLPVVWWIVNRIKYRALFALFAWITFLLLLLTAVASSIDFIEQGLNSLGKDSTLTGRTYLWSVGWKTFLQHPLLGVGYQAFWQEGASTTSQMITAVLDDLSGFHSAYVEVLVATGLLGFTAFLYMLVVTLWRCARWFSLVSSVESLGALFFVFSTIVYGFFDVVVFRQHEIYFLLIVIFAVVSYRQLQFEG